MLKKLIMFTGLLGGSVLFSGQALAAADFDHVLLKVEHISSVPP